MLLKNDLIDLCLKENFELYDENTIIAYGHKYPIGHPVQIHLARYRDSLIPDERFTSFKRVKSLLWPHYDLTDNYWHDRIFEEHCNNRKFIVNAGGANIGKSQAWAFIAWIYYLAAQNKRGVIVSSTSLDSIERRIWGYVARLLEEMNIPMPVKYTGGKPPKIVRPGQKDRITGMYAVAVKEGDAERTIAGLIGMHPPGGVLFILDESTDISSNVVQTFGNLFQTPGFNQVAAIGNSKDPTDLHGALATPLHGWDSIDPDRDFRWPTKHEDGICLYFNPFDSPAIHEKDPIKKTALSNFLITEAKLEKLKEQYGIGSSGYRRFVLGFWHLLQGTEKTLLTPKFLNESKALNRAEWSGLHPLIRIASLDPAISHSQKGCVMRIGLIGHETTGKMVLDMGGEDNIKYIDTTATDDKSSELQLVDNVIYWLNHYRIPLHSLAIDMTGMGRMLGEMLKLRMNSPFDPLKVLWTGKYKKGTEIDASVITISPTEMWLQVRDFIQNSQIRGLDNASAFQFSTRLVTYDDKGRPFMETKPDYVVRVNAIDHAMAYSPNEADTAALLLQCAIFRHGFKLGETRPVVHTTQDFTLQKLRANTLQLEINKEALKPVKQTLNASFSGTLESLAWCKNN